MGIKITHSGSLGMMHSITVSDEVLEHSKASDAKESVSIANELKAMIKKDIITRKNQLDDKAKKRFKTEWDKALNFYETWIYDLIDQNVRKAALSDLQEMRKTYYTKYSPGSRIQSDTLDQGGMWAGNDFLARFRKT